MVVVKLMVTFTGNSGVSQSTVGTKDIKRCMLNDYSLAGHNTFCTKMEGDLYPTIFTSFVSQ